MKDNTFNKYFNKDASEVKASRKDLVLKKVKRGFESAIDQLEEAVLDIDTKLENDRVAVANGNTSRIIALGERLVERMDIGNILKALKSESVSFTG